MEYCYVKNESQYGLLLLQQYLYEHTDDQHPASVADILAFWLEHGIQAGRKSVYSAIEVLQSNGMDIVCVKSDLVQYYKFSRTVAKLIRQRLRLPDGQLFAAARTHAALKIVPERLCVLLLRYQDLSADGANSARCEPRLGAGWLDLIHAYRGVALAFNDLLLFKYLSA